MHPPTARVVGAHPAALHARGYAPGRPHSSPAPLLQPPPRTVGAPFPLCPTPNSNPYICPRSVCHSATVFANSLMHCGTTVDAFLRENLEWLKKATNWAKFSATAGEHMPRRPAGAAAASWQRP